MSKEFTRRHLLTGMGIGVAGGFGVAITGVEMQVNNGIKERINRSVDAQLPSSASSPEVQNARRLQTAYRNEIQKRIEQQRFHSLNEVADQFGEEKIINAQTTVAESLKRETTRKVLLESQLKQSGVLFWENIRPVVVGLSAVALLVGYRARNEYYRHFGNQDDDEGGNPPDAPFDPAPDPGFRRARSMRVPKEPSRQRVNV